MFFFFSDLAKFDENCGGLIELTEPGIDPGREMEVVNQYVYLDKLLRVGGSRRRFGGVDGGGRCHSCKIESNNPEVLAHFPDAKRLPPIVELPYDTGSLDVLYDGSNSVEAETSSALGVQWNTVRDTISSKTAYKDRPLTSIIEGGGR